MGRAAREPTTPMISRLPSLSRLLLAATPVVLPGCVAPEPPPPPRYVPPAAAAPALGPNFETAPLPNRGVHGIDDGVVRIQH